jgi:poly-gamma-glutamate synthesis protein (capsule biosynthesis protein)
MSASELSVLATGDIVLGSPPDPQFDLVRPVMQAGDVVVGHLEYLHTLRGHHALSDPGTSYRPRDPRDLEALGRAGVHVATMAQNHTYDCGPAGIADSIEALRAQGILPVGAGMTIEEARRPALLEREGVRFGFLAYNTVGPKGTWATSTKAGAAYVNVLTHYEQDLANPGGVPTTYTFIDTRSLGAMQEDIEALRARVDILMVSMHRGLVHAGGGVLADYERPLAKAAVDAGADIVVGHHAHALRGVEIYKGKPIYHGLGNFVTVVPSRKATPEGRDWDKRRLNVSWVPFEPDPEYPNYPFVPESKNTMLASCTVSKDGVQSAGFIPCWVHPDASPEPLKHDERGEAVADYVAQLNRNVGLPAELTWEGDRVVFYRAA